MFLEAILVAIHDRMDTRSAIADTMMMAMSTAMSAVPRRSSRRLSDFSDIAHLTNGFKKWRDSSKVTPGEWVHEYLRQKYPSVRAEFEKNAQLVKQHQQTITDIIEMAVESFARFNFADDSLGPLLVSYASENGILEEREGFDRLYWARVSEALCQLSRQFPLKSHKWDTVSSWRIVILFIINKIEYGFQLETKSLKSQRSFDNPCYSKA
ncbi:unnamed protein product [Toxocara canis]|uniref:GLOBIN domain-containing protein n=1 Tax=Toxocara canis TaxID=6265 RepID=A0A183UI91_TOXCA|nr:unnamed protein product [Toxocara canis]